MSNEVTQLLQRIEAEGTGASEKLLSLVYDELRRLADRYLNDERADHTLQPTALVHEAFVRLVGDADIQWSGRGHFFGAAARSMRQILINHAIRKRTAKHGGDRRRVPLDDALAVFEERTLDMLALDEALKRLAEMDPRQSKIVELRFFAGLTVTETAQILECSTKTVERDWALARAWLRRECTGDRSAEGSVE